MSSHSPTRHKGRGKNPARRGAATMLAAIERGKTLDEVRTRLTGLEAQDRRFANAILLSALRHYGEIENILTPLLKRPVPMRPHLARALLYIGVAQLRFMDIAPHAAIHETVAATGRREQPFRGLINAILRRVAKMPPEIGDPLSALPVWLANSWQAAYGQATSLAMATMIQRTAPLDLRFRTPDAADQFCIAHPQSIRLAPGSVRMIDAPAVADLYGFHAGQWWVQDIAAGLASDILPCAIGDPVLDICAAPGGKTMQLAARGAQVTALDQSPTRLARLRENLIRTGLSAELVTANFNDWQAPRQWPFTLLDAPCSATGTLRRHPDLKLHRGPGSAAHMAGLQTKMLTKAANLTQAGGHLVYCVCSLEPEEGEAVVEAFLQATPAFMRQRIDPAILPAALAAAVTCDGWVRTTPDMVDEAGGCDGFFVAHFHKKADAA